MLKINPIKIYKLTQFEKLNINPINSEILNNVEVFTKIKKTFEEVEHARNIIVDGLFKYCNYQSMGANSIPKNPGKLLKKHGRLCNYDIRPKEWDTDINRILDDGADRYVINVYWVAQGGINYLAAQDCLKSMFIDLVKLSKVEDFEIYFFCGCRDTFYVKSSNYDILFKHDPETNETFVFEEN